VLPIKKPIIIDIEITSKLPINQVNYFVNDKLIGITKNEPFDFVIKVDDLDLNKTEQNLKVIVYDSSGKQTEKAVSFNLN